MKDPGKEFPSIRVLGTIGWIAAGMTIGFMKVESSVVQLYVGAVVSALLGIYCFTLPHVPPKRDTKATFAEIIGLDALKLFRERSFALIIIASILTCIPLAFYYSWTNPFLNELGMKFAASKMTMGQMSEIIFMLVMPFFFIRLGVKRMIMIGMAAWVARYLLFAFGNVDSLVWMLYTGIILHGICYDFFFVTGQIFVDKKAPDYLKSSAQGMITFATYGLGMFIGAWFSGIVVGWYTSGTGDNVVHEWAPIWLIPMAIAAFVLVLFTILFRSSESDKKVDVSTA
jgi:nucleoside transporter